MFSRRCRIDDADNFYAAIAGAECGDLGKLPGAVEGNPSPSVRRALPQDFRGILARTTKELERYRQILSGQPALFGKSLRRQIVSIAVQRDLAHLDQALAHAVAQIGIGKAESDPQVTRQLALGQRAIALDRRQQPAYDFRVTRVRSHFAQLLRFPD